MRLMRSVRILLLLTGLGLCGGEPMTKVILPDDVVESYGARCLDGSNAGYYIRENKTSSDWVFWLEGGGLCVTVFDCIERTKCRLGSSKYWDSTMVDNNNVLNDNPKENPFATFNHVFLPYCSGDTWTGIRRTRYAWLGELYTAGHLIFHAVVDHVFNTTSMQKGVDQFLLSGQSAGGIGVFHNADWLQDYLTKSLGLSSVMLKASPQGGLYFPNGVFNFETYAILREHSPPFDIFGSWYVHLIDGSFLDESCVQAQGENPTKCWDTAFLSRYVSTPLFVAENKFDQNQINDILACPPDECSSTTTKVIGSGFMEDYGRSQISSVAAQRF